MEEGRFLEKPGLDRSEFPQFSGFFSCFKSLNFVILPRFSFWENENFVQTLRVDFSETLHKILENLNYFGFFSGTTDRRKLKKVLY